MTTHPRPLTDLDATTCQALQGVAFDVDDTVTRHGRLDPSAYQALWSLADAGLRLVATTGRPHVWACVIAGLWPIDLAVAENGGSWVQSLPGHDHRIEGFFDDAKTRTHQRDQLHTLFESLRNGPIPDLRISHDGPERLVDLTVDAPGRFLRTPEIDEISRRVEAIGGRCLVSSVQAHVTLCKANKATGLVHAARECLNLDLDADRNRWLFIGDSPNDADAFAFFPTSIGVANVTAALPRLHHPPAYITTASHGPGFAEMAAYLLAARA